MDHKLPLKAGTPCVPASEVLLFQSANMVTWLGYLQGHPDGGHTSVYGLKPKETLLEFASTVCVDGKFQLTVMQVRAILRVIVFALKIVLFNFWMLQWFCHSERQWQLSHYDLAHKETLVGPNSLSAIHWHGSTQQGFGTLSIPWIKMLSAKQTKFHVLGRNTRIWT